MRLFKQKKAGLQESLKIATFVSYLVLAVIFGVFIILLSFTTSNLKDITKEKATSINYDLILLNYLRMPVVVDNEEMTMADLIGLAVYSDDYMEKISNPTASYFNRSFQFIEEKKWFTIKVNNRLAVDWCQIKTAEEVAIVVLPSINRDKVTVALVEGRCVEYVEPRVEAEFG